MTNVPPEKIKAIDGKDLSKTIIKSAVISEMGERTNSVHERLEQE